MFAKSKSTCLEAKQIVSDWLKLRGLELSKEKTVISHLDDGFDFLGFNVRRYETKSKKLGKVLLIKPSKDSINKFRHEIKSEWRKCIGWHTKNVIDNIKPKIIGWCNYYKVVNSKMIFNHLDHWMYIRQRRFVERRHPKKNWKWYKNKYWGKIKSREDKWVFMDKKSGTFLWKLAWTPIAYHVGIKCNVSPDNPEYRDYWKIRRKKQCSLLNKLKGILWRKQKGGSFPFFVG
ncbi:hypothetical protein L3V83_15630 [Thiotrichales bacterium 19X7-9]|nr:hypothetical protein [Thiotrichales bacterium 19X7-9]